MNPSVSVMVEGQKAEAQIVTYKSRWSRNPLHLIRQLLRGRVTYDVIVLAEIPPAGARVVMVYETTMGDDVS